MAQIDFGGTIEEVVTLDEFPMEKARKVKETKKDDSGDKE